MPTGTATLDFGAMPADAASVAVTGQAAIVAGSSAEAFMMRDATADNTAEQHDMLAAFGKFSIGTVIAGTGFTIRCDLQGGLAQGQFTVRWAWV